MLLLPIALGLAALVASAASSPTSQQMKAVMFGGSEDARAEEELWWHHAVVYQVYPRSFMDSDGDGIGDLKGITSKLGYLKNIGVGAVWLSPFYPSPQADFGYDISNFKDVDSQYGTLEDFKKMVDIAHQLGLKIVVDLVPNHSSDEHPWFQESMKQKDGPKANFYIWRDGKTDNDGNRSPPNNWVSHFRGSAWEYVKERDQYYLHQFAVKQPDLNYEDKALVQEMKDVFTFWMDNGVDGFRVDALPFLFESDYEKDEPKKKDPSPDVDAEDYDFYDHPYTMDKEGTYDMLQQWREVIDKHPDGKPRVMMTECYTTFDNTIRYYGTEDRPGAHFTFNFQLISYLSAGSGAKDFKDQIDQWMGAMNDWRWPNWVIGNHDNSRVATRFPNMADAMNMVSLTLPGTAMTYYGEELGMTDAFITWDQTLDPQAKNAGPEKYLKVSRDKCRTPMQWDSSPNAGFSSGAKTWLPTNPEYWGSNVDSQKAAKKSHLKTYIDLVELRKTQTMQKGDWKTELIGEDVLKITRSLTNQPTYITVINVGSWVQTLTAQQLLPDQSLNVYAASDISDLSKGDSVPSSFKLRPKGAIVLTTAAVESDPTEKPLPPPSPPPTDKPATTTPGTSGSPAAPAVALISLVLPSLLLLRA